MTRLPRKPRRLTRVEERDRRRSLWLAPLPSLWTRMPEARDDSFNQALPRVAWPNRKPGDQP